MVSILLLMMTVHVDFDRILLLMRTMMLTTSICYLLMTTLILLAGILFTVQELPLLGGDGVQHLRQRVLHAQRDGGHRRPSPVSSVNITLVFSSVLPLLFVFCVRLFQVCEVGLYKLQPLFLRYFFSAVQDANIVHVHTLRCKMCCVGS